MTVLTPTVRQGTKKSLFWLGAVVFLLLAAIGSLLLVGTASDSVHLSPTNPAPDGTMAVVEVLKQQGVDVAMTDSLARTATAVTDKAATTIVLHDPDMILESGQQEELLTLTDHLIVLDPGFSLLQTLAPGVTAAGEPDEDALVAGCSLPAAAKSQKVSSGGTSYRVDGDVDACLVSSAPDSDDAYSLVQLDVDGTTVTIVGATDALTNGEIRAHGNAAFALNLLGKKNALVWYLPTLADVAGAGDAVALTPRWLTPSIVLVTLTALAAAFWRGRRFGPLIIENLPVIVRSSETTEGRARLYQKSSAQLRALDALRMGSIGRLASRCGLPGSATVDEVVFSVAALVRTDHRKIRNVLVDSVPTSDADLVRLSDRLLELEAEVAKALPA